MSKIGIVGTGYVGLVTGVSFANLGFQITCLDVLEDKINQINAGIPPIYEKGLDSLLKIVVNKGLLRGTLSREDMFNNSDVIFICLPTPSSEDGKINLKYIREEVIQLGKLLQTTSEYKTIVVKSTVVPGTTDGIVKQLLEQESGKTAGIEFGLAMNPEFLMEGLALENFQHPDRIVIGAIDDKSFNSVNNLYQSFTCPIQKVTNSAAEMVKYAANSFLATKISFINEIANMCELLDINVSDVANGMGSDSRISEKFLRAGVGFGGSCFPKDVKALHYLSKELNKESKILKATLEVNQYQPLRIIEILEKEIEIKGSLIGLLGLAFKPDTDDMREAPSITIANKLMKKGAIIYGYDPIAKISAREALPDIIHCKSVEELLEKTDVVILITEWSEFKNLTSRDFNVRPKKLIVDGRRILNWKELETNGNKIKVIGQTPP
ncbi:MAG: UDP-glucose/GDP-mannose dehydrogenase family protein [Candidatus Heimdallarchaeota archaeon]|nr:UDP-glucose/GDP-mannose dehydrogenase family protein [Candidatus Heimdallarchaeota archaeon]MDH5644643.1 UDP-glucose/GDP-mannose dehydrogenase family protein [Candidatus Heimdallarchaeota archaeon]